MDAPGPPPLPPYYVLIAHSHSLNNLSVPASTSSLSHPLIEYHYADDPPNSLLPHHAEHVIVLDFDPARPSAPSVKSLSSDLVVSALKVTDAPGAGVAGEPVLRNNSMYVIETMSKPVENVSAADDDDQSVQAVLARFKQRNAVLHRIIDQTHAVNGTNQELTTSPEQLPQA